MSRGTTPRTIRISDDLWELVRTQAGAENMNVSDLIRSLLRGWLNQHQSGQMNDEAVDAAAKGKSYGTSRKLGIYSDVEVPIVKTRRPAVTVVDQTTRRELH